MTKLKGYEEKAKRVLAINKLRLLVSDLKDLLHWKLADEFSNTTKGMKVQQLRALQEVHKDDVVADIIVPEESAEPTVLGIQDTELGCIAQKKYQDVIATGNNLDNEDLQKITQELLVMCNARGVSCLQCFI